MSTPFFTAEDLAYRDGIMGMLCPHPSVVERANAKVASLIEQIEKLRAALEWITQWADGCPANSDYDKGLKAAHDALASKARAALNIKSDVKSEYTGSDVKHDE
jgi:hypothetical protein